MSPDENAWATTEGDAQGHVSVGDYILQIGDRNGGVVHAAPRSQETDYKRRKGQANLRPRPFLALLNREEEIATLKLALQASRHVSLYGPSGIGKTSLLRSIAHLPEAGVFPGGVVYLSVSGEGPEDILQSLFDAFHDSQVNFKPIDAEIRIALLDIKALILLDDLGSSRHEIISLLDAAPNCTFVSASVEKISWENGEHVEVTGLPVEDALDLFVLELNRSLDMREQAEVREICGLLAGHPLRILQSASLVREKAATIYGVKTRLQQDEPDDVILRTSLESFTDSQQSLIAILAAAEGALVPVKLLEGLSESQELKNDLQKLVSLGLLQVHDSKFSLAGDLSVTLSHLWDLTSRQDRLVKFLVDWIQTEPAEYLLDGSIGLFVQTLRIAEHKGHWQEVISLGRGVESFLILSRRWQTWLHILNLILKAAGALADRNAEAWALHQIGTRAACLGLSEQGREFLMRALHNRRAIRDQAGQRVTQRNLHVFFNIPLPANLGKSGWRRCLTCGTIAAGVIGIASILIAGLFLFISSQSDRLFPAVISTASVTQTPTLTSNGAASPSRTVIPSATSAPNETPTLLATAVPTILVDFVLEADTATWESSALLDPSDDEFGDCDLIFGAPPSRPCGFARWESAILEGDSAPQTVLVVQPYHSNSARVWGTYDLTDWTIGSGDRLVTSVGFLNAAETSGATFRVFFVMGDPGTSPLLVYETKDRDDGILVEAITPLSEELIGQSGYFILEVSSSPNTDTNWASWVVARLERP